MDTIMYVHEIRELLSELVDDQLVFYRTKNWCRGFFLRARWISQVYAETLRRDIEGRAVSSETGLTRNQQRLLDAIRILDSPSTWSPTRIIPTKRFLRAKLVPTLQTLMDNSRTLCGTWITKRNKKQCIIIRNPAIVCPCVPYVCKYVCLLPTLGDISGP